MTLGPEQFSKPFEKEVITRLTALETEMHGAHEEYHRRLHDVEDFVFGSVSGEGLAQKVSRLDEHNAVSARTAIGGGSFFALLAVAVSQILDHIGWPPR